MAISGLILFSVGSAIAKHIVKSWLGTDLLDGLAEELIDLVKDEGRQITSLRRLQSDTEKMAAAMSSRMHQIYNNSSLANNSKQAVAIEVALTLNKANLGVEHIVAYNMDSEKLARVLLESRPDATKLLSADETALYERLISETAFAQVQMSGLLESFTGAFAAKLLKDNERLLSLVEKLLQEPDEGSRKFVTRYKETVKRKLDRLEVFGLPKLDRYSRQLSLSTAYISLDAEPRNLDIKFVKALYEHYEEITPSIKINQDALTTSSVNRVRNELLHHIDLYPITKELADSKWSDYLRKSVSLSMEIIMAQRPNSIESVLAGKRRVIVQGQAGSGKTTLLQWLAVRAAAGDFQPPLAGWNQAIPFFMRLREYVNKGFPAPQEFLEPVMNFGGW